MSLTSDESLRGKGQARHGPGERPPNASLCATIQLILSSPRGRSYRQSSSPRLGLRGLCGAAQERKRWVGCPFGSIKPAVSGATESGRAELHGVFHRKPRQAPAPGWARRKRAGLAPTVACGARLALPRLSRCRRRGRARRRCREQTTRQLGAGSLLSAAWRGIVHTPRRGDWRAVAVRVGDASAGVAPGWLALARRVARSVPGCAGRRARGSLARGRAGSKTPWR